MLSPKGSEVFAEIMECLEQGLEVDPEKIRLHEIEEGKRKEIQKQTRYENSGVGKKYWGKTFDSIEMVSREFQQNAEVVKKFVEDVNKGMVKSLWMCGNNGTGKTLLASLAVRECGGRFARSYEIEDELADAASFRSSETRKNVYNRYREYGKVLVIDEVGRFPSDNELKSLFHILNDRYEEGLSTIIVTNLERNELKKYLGKALVDRFLENCTSISFEGESYRIKEREAK